MIALLVKSSLILGIAWLFYKVVLQRESFFAVNRMYFWAALVLAFVLPFVSLPPLVTHQGYLSTLLLGDEVFETPAPSSSAATPYTPQELMKEQPQEATKEVASKKAEEAAPISARPTLEEPVAEPKSWTFWLLALYLFGVGIFTLNLLFQLGNVWLRIYTSSDTIDDKGYTIVNLPQLKAPHSFFRYIFIHPDAYDFETYEQIISHEKIHVQLQHTWDLLLAELVGIVLWFNPIVWMLKQEMEKNIEYQTDDLLLRGNEVNKETYQWSLLQIAAPHKPLAITTNYNQSLLKQRIRMINAKKSTMHNYWKYAFMAPLFFGVLLVINKPAVSQATSLIGYIGANKQQIEITPAPSVNPTPAPVVSPTPHVSATPTPAPVVTPEVNANPTFNFNPNIQVNPNVTVDVKTKPSFSFSFKSDVDMSAGYWYGHVIDNQYCIEFKGGTSSRNSYWNMSECFDKSLFAKKSNDSFTLARDAGTLTLQGTLDQEVSQGKYSFAKDAGFESYLAKNDITNTDKNFLFHLFMGNVDRKYVAFLKDNYKEIDGNRLQELAIHGISQADYQMYVTMFDKYAKKRPEVREVIEARIHGITQEYIEEMQTAGFKDLSMRKIMELKIHGVSRKYIDELKSAGFDNLAPDQILEAKIHGISASSAKEIKALGFGDMSLRKMIELKIHGINAEYIDDLGKAGFKNLELNKIIEAKIHGINAEEAKKIRALGYGEMSLNKMIEIKIHGVNAEFIKDLNDAGFKNLELNRVLDAKIHGVNADYVKELADVGFKNLEFNKVLEAKIHGVTADFIKDARKEGYNPKDFDEYIRLKIHGMASRRSRD